MNLILALLLFVSPAFAADNDTLDKVKTGAGEVVDYTADKVDAAANLLGEAFESRGQRKYVATVGYSYFDLWVPSKIGFSIAYNDTPSSTYELEYFSGSFGYDYFGVDLGKISDQRISPLWRSYNQRNSFNFLMGANYTDYNIKLGDTVMNSISPSKRGEVEVLEYATLGLTWGIGNRWQQKNGFVWSFDWLVINLPIATLKARSPFLNEATNENARDEVETMLKMIRHLPSGLVAKIQLGYSF